MDARNVYIIKTSATGDVLWETTVGNAAEAYAPRAVTPTADGGCAVVGSIRTQAPSQYVFMIKVDGLTTGIKTVTAQEAGFAFYPNPATNVLHLQTPVGMNVRKVELLDMTGRVLQSNLYNGSPLTNIDINRNIHGPVMLRATTDKEVVVGQLYVQ
jgi:hypothetical protein